MTEMQPPQVMDPAFLIGSQLETYQKLVAMGFNQTDSATVAQVFGSNVDGAVNCVLTGGAAKLMKMHSVVSAEQSAAKKLEIWKLPTAKYEDDKIIEFRRTPFSDKLMCGYIREQSLDYVIPDVIHIIIIKYFNLYFIKLNYNVNNDDLIDEMDEKHHHDDDHVDHEDDEKTALLPSLSFRYRILALQTNQSLKRIAIALEETYEYIYKDKDIGDYVNRRHYSYFVHVWMRFCYLKSIYPLSNKNMKISMSDIDKCNREKPDRWVEVPNDFEDITVHDIDKLIAEKDKNGILELGIERFDQHNNIWPFRNKKLVPLQYEIVHSNKAPPLQPPKRIKCLYDSPPSPRSPPGSPKDIKYLLDSPQSPSPPPPSILPVVNPKISASDKQIVVEQNDNDNEQDANDADGEDMDDDMSPSPMAPLPIAPSIRDWKCANCGRDNDKTFVFCCGCFRDKAEAPTTARRISPRSLQSFVTNMRLHPDTDKAVKLPQKALPSTAPIPLSSVEWTNYLQIGDIIDANDEQDKWYESVIRYIETNEDNEMVLSIHYIGWNKKWDEKLLANNIQRIAKRNIYTKGPHRPKISSYNENKPNPPTYAYPDFPTCLPKSFRFAPISLKLNQHKESNGYQLENVKDMKSTQKYIVRGPRHSSKRHTSLPTLPLSLLPNAVDDTHIYHSDTNAVIGHEDALYLQSLAKSLENKEITLNQAESDQDADQL